MKLFENTVESQLIYDGKIIALRKDKVRLENDKIVTREVIDHPGAVAIVALDEKENLLMVRQYRYPCGRTVLEIPAGKLEKGENPLSCAKRELEEETGYTAQEFVSMHSLLPSPAYLTEEIHLYFAKGLTLTAQNLDEDEFLTLEKIPFDTAVKMVLEGEILDAKTQIALMKYSLLRSQGSL